MSISEFYTKQAALAAELLPKYQTLKARGISGFRAAHQLVDELVREERQTDFAKKSPKQTACEQNRVEFAFAQLTATRKKRLLLFARMLAREQGKRIKWSLDVRKPLAEFSQDERAFIASALKEMNEIKDHFPLNMRFYEFHPPKPKGTKKWMPSTIEKS